MTIQSKLVGELLRLGAYLQREGGRITREFGLSQQHFVVLRTVSLRGPLCQKDLRSELLYEKSNISKAITNLENKGLVRTSKASADARLLLAQTTAQGEAIVKACMERFDAWNAAWLQDYPDDKIIVAYALLHNLGKE